MPKPQTDWDALSQMMAGGEPQPSGAELMSMMRYGYDGQHSFRERHPLIDAFLNFVPVVGTATSLDDTAAALMKSDYAGAALNAVGILPGGKLLKGAKSAGNAVANSVAKTLIAQGKGNLVPATRDAMEAAGNITLRSGLSAYFGDAAAKEKQNYD